jgi:hypothetical protein
LGRLRRLYQDHHDRVAFLFIQISDGGHPLPPELQSVLRREGLEEETPANRRARLCRSVEVMRLPFLSLLDSEDGRVERLYAAWPERLVIVAPDGRIALDAGGGVWGSWDYAGVEQHLRELEEEAEAGGRHHGG